MQKARFVKYCVLFVLVILFFLSRNRATLAADPLISIFSPLAMLRTGLRLASVGATVRSGWMWLIVAAAVAGAIFYPRFWCRYLCPVGAFLSLFNNVVILKRYLPAKRFGRCEFGLTAKDQMACIYCDRCRYSTKLVLKEEILPAGKYAPMSPLSRYFMVSVLAVAILVSVISANKFLEVTPVRFEAAASVSPAHLSLPKSAGQPRDVDLQRVRSMIEQKQLSDHEAQFYKKAE
jgi:hypothetical protein